MRRFKGRRRSTVRTLWKALSTCVPVRGLGVWSVLGSCGRCARVDDVRLGVRVWRCFRICQAHTKSGRSPVSPFDRRRSVSRRVFRFLLVLLPVRPLSGISACCLLVYNSTLPVRSATSAPSVSNPTRVTHVALTFLVRPASCPTLNTP